MTTSFDIVQPRVPDGLGLYLKSRATGRHYRIEPTRHPEQPRFWVLRVVRCQRPGVTDTSFGAWTGARSYTLSDLPTALAGIKADVAAWLEEEHHSSLRLWFEEGERTPLSMFSLVGQLTEPPKRAAVERAPIPVAGFGDILAPAESVEETTTSEIG